jgi:hypothetical protein
MVQDLMEDCGVAANADTYRLAVAACARYPPRSLLS